MAVDKNFVVKNGIEVNSNLIIADANTKKVGIGSTGPRVTLDVRGGIAATDGLFTGVLTCTTLRGIQDYGILNGTGANVSGVSTFSGSVNINNLTVTGFTTFADISLDEVNARNLNVTGIATVPTFVGLSAFDKISVSGISTITSLDSTNASVSGILTATNRILVRSDDSTPGRIDYYCEVSNAHYTRVQSAPHAEYSGNVTAVLPTVSGDFIVGDTSSDISQSVRTSGIVTASAFHGDGANVTGISTLNIVNYSGGAGVGGTNIFINTSGIVTAAAFFTSGIITASSFSGDGSQLTGLGIGINTATGLVGYGFTHLHFRGAGVSTTNYNTNLGIATIFFEGGGGGGISSVFDDTTPKLAGNLDLNGNDITGSGNIPAANLTGVLPGLNAGSLTNLNGSNIASGTISAARVALLNQDTTGNAATATALANTITIGGVSFDGSTSINLPGVNQSGTQDTSGTATNATNITLADESTDTTCFPVFATSATGNQAPKTSSNLTYDSADEILSCTDFNTTSDINLKKDIEIITNANEILNQINGVNFTWIKSNKPSIGIIAQEIEKVLPQLVNERTDTGTKSVNYNGLIGVLIEAVKELSQRVEELERK